MESVLIKLCISAVCGLILGIERESKHKPLGLKTCVVISVASCLLTIVSIEAATGAYSEHPLVRADPMRLAAQIVSGVGFLGAGVILRKSNDAISGLTTAAIVWAASGLGITVGAGYFLEALSGVALIFLGVKVIPYIVKKIGPRALREQEIKINVFVPLSGDLQKVFADIRQGGINVKDIKIKGKSDGHKVELQCTVIDGKDCIYNTYETVRVISDVDRAEIEAM